MEHACLRSNINSLTPKVFKNKNKKSLFMDFLYKPKCPIHWLTLNFQSETFKNKQPHSSFICYSSMVSLFFFFLPLFFQNHHLSCYFLKSLIVAKTPKRKITHTFLFSFPYDPLFFVPYQNSKSILQVFDVDAVNAYKSGLFFFN